MDEALISPQRVAEVADALAKALDGDDFVAAARYLAEQCEYDTGQDVYQGRAAVLESYAQASVWAHGQFDDVRYESEVESIDGSTATVRYTDYLVKAGGHFHRHRCCQELTVGPEGAIVRIVHRELDGEREALERFFEECGIER